MGLREMAARDAARLCGTSGDFAETILYKFKATGSTCSIPALVFRSPIQRSSGDRGRSSTSAMQMEVALEHVPKPQIGDMIKVSPRRGQPQVWMNVSEIIPRGEADGGSSLLGVGR